MEMLRRKIRVNDLTDLEKVNPREILVDQKRYYYIPGIERYVISKKGEVFDLLKNNRIETYENKHCKKVTVNLFINGKRRNKSLARILGITFIGRPSRHLNKKHDELEINHIDGNRYNNLLENLEWVTSRENVEHAHFSELHPLDRGVLARNVKTNEIKYFNSIRSCAIYFQIHRATLWKHLVKGRPGKYHVNWFVFKFNDQSQWVNYPLDQLLRLGDETESGLFSVHDKDNQERIILSGFKNVSHYTGISISSLFRHLERKGIYENSSYTVMRLTKNLE